MDYDDPSDRTWENLAVMLQDVPVMVHDYFATAGFRVEPDSLNPDYFRLVKLSLPEKKKHMLKATSDTLTNEDTTLTRKTESPKLRTPPAIVNKQLDVIEISSGESKKNVPKMQVLPPIPTPKYETMKTHTGTVTKRD